jgi:dimethylamine monooxygenase subunit C
MVNLADTSVPAWAVGAAVAQPPDDAGASYLIVGVGEEGRALAQTWASALDGRSTAIYGDDAREVSAAVAAALHTARVGLRVRLAGPAGACLTLRGLAVTAGVEDDELHVSAVGDGPVEVLCVHCQAVTTAAVAIGDAVPCIGCRRGLVVYYHVSRRTGQFLGYMLDAEEADG